MPDPQKVLATIRRATELTRSTPGRTGSVVHLNDLDDVLVVGDLHGNLSAFKLALHRARLDQNPRRHLVLQELVHGPNEYPNGGGDTSHQLVDVCAALKCQYPDRVHVLLGNHELSELTGRPIAKDGRALNADFRLGLDTAYGTASAAIYGAYLELFRSLPLAIRLPNRVYLCHTYPEEAWFEGVDWSILETGDWTPESMRRGGTVYAMTWGRDNRPENVERFLAKVDCDLVVTGHVPCDNGFRQPNEHQLIVDGTPPCPACCLIPANEPVTIERLVAAVHILGLDR